MPESTASADEDHRRYVQNPHVYARNLRYVYFDGPWPEKRTYLGVYAWRNGFMICEAVREVDPNGHWHPEHGPRPTFIEPHQQLHLHMHRPHLLPLPHYPPGRYQPGLGGPGKYQQQRQRMHSL